MFTCAYKQECLKAEEEARKKHFGQSKGFRYLLKKFTWKKWKRNKCSSKCAKHSEFETKEILEFCDSKGFKDLIRM